MKQMVEENLWLENTQSFGISITLKDIEDAHLKEQSVLEDSIEQNGFPSDYQF